MVVVIGLIGVFGLFFGPDSEPSGPISSGPIVEINSQRWPVEIVDEPAEQAQGLSGRSRLPAGQGMLFIFPEPGLYGFWMKDMNFPLDFVWISGDRVAGVTEDVPPCQLSIINCQLFYPPERVDVVLEVNAGEVERSGIKAGAAVVIELE